MSFNNRNNLPNPSAPWGREVEQRIESAERNISQTSLESSNGLSSVSNTLNGLQKALIGLDSLVTRIAESRTVTQFVNTISYSNPCVGSTYISEYVYAPSWATTAVVTVVSLNMQGSFTGSAITDTMIVGPHLPNSGDNFDLVSGSTFDVAVVSGATKFTQKSMTTVVDVSDLGWVALRGFAGTGSGTGTANFTVTTVISIDWA